MPRNVSAPLVNVTVSGPAIPWRPGAACVCVIRPVARRCASIGAVRCPALCCAPPSCAPPSCAARSAGSASAEEKARSVRRRVMGAFQSVKIVGEFHERLKPDSPRRPAARMCRGRHGGRGYRADAGQPPLAPDMTPHHTHASAPERQSAPTRGTSARPAVVRLRRCSVHRTRHA